MGTWTLGADNATVRNVPEPGPGPIQARRPIPQLSRINAIRFDGKSIYHGLTLKARAAAARATSPTTSATRCRTSKDDASSPGADRVGSERAAERAEHLRRDAASGRSRASTIATSSSPAASYQLPFFREAARARPGRCWAAGALNAIFIAQSGAPFTVNLGVDRANIGAGPAQRPDQLRDPNLPGGERTPERWFDTSAFALPAPFTFGSAPRNSVIGPGFANVDFARRQDVGLSAASARSSSAGRSSTCSIAPTSTCRTAIFGNAELRPDLQREEPARDAVRPAARVLRPAAGWLLVARSSRGF